MTAKQEQLTNILKEMFQFDQADLDFGIYRIMAMRRDEVQKFLSEDLPQQITDGLAELSSVNAENEIQEIENHIEGTQKLPISDAQKNDIIATLEEKKKALSAKINISNVEDDVYNHLINFFSRYYDEGDFISQRRYKDGVYAIPYEGEEVKLHWANADQYYVKTTEYFKDYTFKTSTNKTVHFKVVEAETEKDNNKSNGKRFFQLYTEKPFELIDDELFMYVEYKNGDKKDQNAYNAEIIAAFSDIAISDYRDFATIITDKKDDKTMLERQIQRYTARNTFDYFIHKDLGKFLHRELDFYIKNDVIFLDDIDDTDDTKLKGYMTKAKVIRKIAKKMITFLAQIEDFQKKLFLKKKFVVETNYCITLDRIPETFYDEIIENTAQQQEWVNLFAINEIQADLLSPSSYSSPLTKDFLKQNQFLVLDTTFFTTEFKEKLIDSIENLDESLGGLMVHSENFQALNLLQERYREQIKCVYIDPPYNTDASKIIYKNGYEHSTWISLLFDRMSLGHRLMSADSIQSTAIDEYELKELYFILEQIFSRQNCFGILAIRSNPSGRPTVDGLALSHEYTIINKKSNKAIIAKIVRTDEQKARYDQIDEYGVYEQRNFRREGSNSDREDGIRQWYPIYVNIATLRVRVPNMTWNSVTESWNILDNENDDEVIVYPINDKGEEKNWRWSWDNVQKNYHQFYAKYQKSGHQVYYKFRPNNDGITPLTFWGDTKYSSVEYGTKLLKNIFPSGNFSYPKSLYAIIDILSIMGLKDKNHIALDYFAGSGTTGHAVINLNREDGGNRKYILVEMGEYFDTVTRPRIKKVIYSEDWKDGKPVSRKGSSHAMKYIRLESYEDTLNNIILDKPQLELSENIKEEYLLSYMLNIEAKNSDSLLNIDKLSHPFNYVLNITQKLENQKRAIDLVETFNYLIGLQVEHSHAISSYDADFTTGDYKVVTASLKEGKTYKIKMIEGKTLDGENTLIIWRDMTGDVEKDNAVLDAFFKEKKINTANFGYKKIYVNCDNNLQNMRTDNETWKVILIEEEMKKRMFEGV